MGPRQKKISLSRSKKQKDPLVSQIEFARPYLIQPLEGEDLDSFSRSVVETFKARLSHWTVAKLEDGHPVIGEVPGRIDLPFNEYVYWTLMAKRGIDAEIILTNQFVASVEYIPTPVHTSIRGGITGGSTEYNPSSRFGSSVWVSLFPYLSDDTHIREYRNGDTYTRNEALSYAGAMLAHENGPPTPAAGTPVVKRGLRNASGGGVGLCRMGQQIRRKEVSDWFKPSDETWNDEGTDLVARNLIKIRWPLRCKRDTGSWQLHDQCPVPRYTSTCPLDTYSDDAQRT